MSRATPKSGKGLALVTGATGLVGAHLVRRLLKEGYAVRALALPGEGLGGIAGLPVQVAQGDILQPATLPPALRGVDWLFHVAGCTDEWARNPRRVFDLNVLGTRHVLGAALLAGSVRRVVYTSTCAAVATGTVQAPANEESVWDFFHVPSPYFQSKLLAEKEAMQWGLRGLALVTVNPFQVIGAYDSKPSPTGQVILDFARGRLPAWFEGYVNWVDARALAWGHLAALEKGRAGERYILAGDTLHTREVFALLSELTGQPMPRIKIPHALLEGVAHPLELLANHVTHQHPLITVGMARALQKPVVVSSEKARRELGFNPPPIREALGLALSWFRDQGMI